MKYYFDILGRITDTPDETRWTSVPHPATEPPVGFVWHWTFTDWVLQVETPPEVQPPVQVRKITPLAFRRRFTKAERAAVEWAAVDKPDRPDAERQLAAALRADLKDQEQASHIDLNDAELIEGLNNLETFGLIATGRAEEILSAPVQDEERA